MDTFGATVAKYYGDVVDATVAKGHKGVAGAIVHEDIDVAIAAKVQMRNVIGHES